MFKNICELLKFLTRRQKQQLLRLQFLVIAMAIAEVVSVLSIGPFMALVGNANELNGDGQLGDLYEFSGINDPYEFLFWMGVAVLFILSLSAVVSMYGIWRLSLFGQRIGAELSVRLFKHYLYQPYIFHISGSSASLTSRIAQEASRVTGQILTPLMQLNARLVMAGFMCALIFILNPLVAVIGTFVFGIAYFILYRTARRSLSSNGKVASICQRKGMKMLSEGFGGIKDILLMGRQKYLIRCFEENCNTYAYAQGTNAALVQIPRYAVELLAFAIIIFLVLYLLWQGDGNLETILPKLSIYALAGFKLLPACQQVFHNASIIKGNISAFESIRDDLLLSRNRNFDSATSSAGTGYGLRSGVSLKGVSFRYPGQKTFVINNLTMDIPARKMIGIVGSSGSGKSTAIDIILGLLCPQLGQLLVDGTDVNGDISRWQSIVGYVPQSIFLSDASIRENIAFGLPIEDINSSRLEKSIEISQLRDLVDSLPQGLETRVGERGVQLSGGQRQRIGLARALYEESQILILDEATSALDVITESLVMEGIRSLSGEKTIILVAHRLSTVKQCDHIFLMKDGKLDAAGTFDQLYKTNDYFNKMASIK